MVRKRAVQSFLLIALFLTFFGSPAYGSSSVKKVTITNEMIYQKLLEIEHRVTDIEKRQAIFEERFKQIDKRFEELREDINKRFEDINERFEDINRRFDDFNKRFEQLYTFLWIITGIFTAIMVGAFGFAYWDRRTIIAEAKRQVYEEIDKEFKPEKFKKLLNSLRELAKINKEIREILKKEGLL